MKRFVFIAAMAALLISSCDKKEQIPVSGNNEVKFTISSSVTRVTTIGNTTAFQNDDKIAITSNGLVNDIKNASYTVTSNTLESDSESTIYYDGENTAEFIAHYPASAVNDGYGNVSMTIAADQSDDAKFHSSMFMVASATGSAAENEGAVTFSFEHQLAMVKVIIDGFDATDVTINGVQRDVTWNKPAEEENEPHTLADESEEPATINVKAWKQEDAQEYWAVIPAQTFVAGSNILTITDGTDTYEYTLPEETDLTVNKGKVKTITMTITPEGQTSATFAFNDVVWEDEIENLEGEATLKVEPPLALISEENGDFANVTELNANVTGKHQLSTGWGTVIAETSGTANADITVSDGAATIKGNGTGSWYNKNLAYLTKDVKPGTYTLTIESKVSEVSGTADNNDLQVMLMQAGTQDNVYYMTGGNNYGYPKCTAEYETKTFDFVIPENAVLTNGVIFMVTPKKANTQTFHIKKITLIEKK